MCCCHEQKHHEVANVSKPNAGAHPRTMVIVHFNTKITLWTMKSSWWPYNITAGAIRKLILGVAGFSLCDKLELLLAVELLGV